MASTMSSLEDVVTDVLQFRSGCCPCRSWRLVSFTVSLQATSTSRPAVVAVVFVLVALLTIWPPRQLRSAFSLVLPLLLASPKISLERPAIKWQPLRLSTISSGTRHCYVYRTSVLFFLVSLFLSFLSSVAASLNPIRSFDSRLRTGSILCYIASETVVPTTTRQFIDPCTIPRSDIQTTLQIVQFLSPCSRFFRDQINTGFLSRYSRRV